MLLLVMLDVCDNVAGHQATESPEFIRGGRVGGGANSVVSQGRWMVKQAECSLNGVCTVGIKEAFVPGHGGERGTPRLVQGPHPPPPPTS